MAGMLIQMGKAGSDGEGTYRMMMCMGLRMRTKTRGRRGGMRRDRAAERG